MSDRRMYTSRQRRAMNIIWTASGEYNFQPDFMAFQLDGEPDFYMNSIIGYVRKWYDPDIMEQLFSTIQEGLFKETYDGLLWIALENCAFQREAPYRPVLEELRLEHARDFFRQDDQKSRQQWMAQNSLVYALESAKWRQVLGKERGWSIPGKDSFSKTFYIPEILPHRKFTTVLLRSFTGISAIARIIFSPAFFLVSGKDSATAFFKDSPAA